MRLSRRRAASRGHSASRADGRWLNAWRYSLYMQVGARVTAGCAAKVRATPAAVSVPQQDEAGEIDGSAVSTGSAMHNQCAVVIEQFAVGI